MTNENEIVIPNNIKIALSGGNLIIGDFSRVIDLNFIGTIPDGKNMFFPVYNPLMLVIFNDNGAVKLPPDKVIFTLFGVTVIISFSFILSLLCSGYKSGLMLYCIFCHQFYYLQLIYYAILPLLLMTE